MEAGKNENKLLLTSRPELAGVKIGKIFMLGDLFWQTQRNI